MLSAGGVGGQAGGRGERGHRDSTGVKGANRVTTEKREGLADQGAELPSAASPPGS